MGNMFFGIFHEIQNYLFSQEVGKTGSPEEWFLLIEFVFLTFPTFGLSDLKLIFDYGMAMAQNRHWSAERLAEFPDSGKQDQRYNEKTIDPWTSEQPQYFQQWV